MLVLLLTGLVLAAAAEMYKYQDESGAWHFSDTPPPDADVSVETVPMAVRSEGGGEDLAQRLWEQYAPQSRLEYASLAAVTIYSDIAKGSGFFVTTRGHLLTNRHVLEGDHREMADTRAEYEAAEDRLAHAESWFRHEADQMAQAEEDLEKMKRAIDHLNDSENRRSAMQLYQERRDRYQAWKADFEAERRRYEAYREQHRDRREKFEYRATVAGAASHFWIVIKDGSRLNARLIRTSRNHDLALLKVDGYQTPRLEPPETGIPGQGSPVYALGSPMTLSDSVSRGVVAGYENGFVKTDAKIYPGNSGGPLVTEEGRVIGINTFKQLTRDFEGLGFAIPITTAMREFAAELE
ncbi:MAG: trypsin-like peptidase domain-containing protein [Desulfosudaceae bacterium]